MSFENKTAILQFLKNNNWANAKIVLLAQDASSRNYYRLQQSDKTAILMQATSDADICPPAATEQQRQQLGYTATARLAANNCGAFICIANELSSRGFSAPRVLATDLQNDLVLLEDLGEQMFSGLLQQNPNQEPQLYQQAVSMLAALARASFNPTAQTQHLQWPLLQYDLPALLAETDLLSDWYLPYVGVNVDDELKGQLRAAWVQVLQPLLQQPQVLVLRDFHADNLLWLPDRQHISNIGLLDFQDAVFGHPAYDLVSLLQDARRDVSPKLEQPLIDSFIEQAKLSNAKEFNSNYRILGAERAAKILGIFVRLAKRDNKQHYLKMLPRVEKHFMNNLAFAELQPIAKILTPLLPNRSAK